VGANGLCLLAGREDFVVVESRGVPIPQILAMPFAGGNTISNKRHFHRRRPPAPRRACAATSTAIWCAGAWAIPNSTASWVLRGLDGVMIGAISAARLAAPIFVSAGVTAHNRRSGREQYDLSALCEHARGARECRYPPHCERREAISFLCCKIDCFGASLLRNDESDYLNAKRPKRILRPGACIFVSTI